MNYNGRPHLAECLASLVTQSRSPKEIILVDNGSTDGSVEFVKTHFPSVRLLAETTNRGFAAGCNLAARQATGDCIAFVNNDVRADVHWLEELIRPLESDPGVIAVQSLVLLYDEPDLINTSATTLNFLGIGWCRDYRRPRAAAQVGEIPIVSGAAFAMRHQTFLDVGGFDEEYFMYHEDVDLSWRLRLIPGQLVLAPASVVYHKYRFVRNAQKNYFLERNRLITLFKNCHLATLALFLPALLMTEVGICLLAARQGWLRAKLSGYRDVLRMAPSIVRKRRLAQRLRRLPDRAVKRWWVGSVGFEEVDSPLIRFGSGVLRLYWAAARPLIVW